MDFAFHATPATFSKTEDASLAQALIRTVKTMMPVGSAFPAIQATIYLKEPAIV